jgi:glycosyltransferase involved in cell wall biosynthesis
MKQRILFVCNETQVGGAERSMLELLDKYPDPCVEFLVVIPGPGTLFDLLAGKYDVRFFPMVKIRKQKNLLSLLNTCGRILLVSLQLAVFVVQHRVDLVYANSTQAHYYTALVKLFTFKKTIWHVRDNIPHSFASRLLSMFCNRTISVSAFISSQVQKPRSGKAVIYNGLDLDYWHNKTDTTPSAAPFKQLPGQLIVGNVGQMTHWKRQTDLIYAAETVVKSFNNVLFILAGSEDSPGGNHYCDSLKRLVREKNLERHFCFVGFSDNMKILMNQFDILVHCAIAEPFGRSIIEAMALGKPVIAYNSGGPAEIITHAINGWLVDSTNPAQLSSGIASLLDQPATRRALGENAKKAVASKFQSRYTAQKVQEVITACLSN